MSANEMTGGEAMARMLKALNAGPMFGMGGFQLLAFYDAARRLKLDHHLINDERCGAFAADAYAKVSGRVGLVDATLGPGATNLATGLVEALNARLGEQAPPPAAPVPAPPSRSLEQQLDRLEELLMRGDFGARSLYRELADELAASCGEQARTLGHYVMGHEDLKALAALRTLRERSFAQ